jgi:hypothetical protein
MGQDPRNMVNTKIAVLYWCSFPQNLIYLFLSSGDRFWSIDSKGHFKYPNWRSLPYDSLAIFEDSTAEGLCSNHGCQAIRCWSPVQTSLNHRLVGFTWVYTSKDMLKPCYNGWPSTRTITNWNDLECRRITPCSHWLIRGVWPKLEMA